MPGRLNNLGNALFIRFKRVGDLDDLEQAITKMGYAIELAPENDPNMPSYLSNLGDALRNRFERLGELDDLERAIARISRAIELTPDGHPNKPRRLSNLGNALFRRFERVGELSDLKRAIARMGRAIELTPDSHPDKSRRLSGLGNALFRRFERIGELDDLERAIARMGDAIELTKDGHPDKPAYMCNLGTMLYSRFKRVGKPNDLERAIVGMVHAIQLIPDDHPAKAACLNNLGSALIGRFEHVGELDDLKQAIARMDHAIKLTPKDHPNMPSCLNNLGNALLRRFARISSLDDLNTAFQYFRLAADQSSGPPRIRLQALKSCARTCRMQIQLGCTTYQTLFGIYDHGFSLIPQVAWLGNSINQRFEFLSQIGEMVTDAVSAAIEVGQHQRAVEWLDQGRGVVWGQLTQLRTPVDELEDQHPALAKELRSVSLALDSSGSSGEVDSILSSEPSSQVSRDNILHDESSARIKLAKDYEALLAQIRGLEGFERFLWPKTVAELRPASEGGPIILLNVHESRCDALVICQHVDDIIHVPLPELSEEMAKALCSQLFDSLVHAGVRKRDSGWRGMARTAPLASDVLECLWSQLVHPILQSIKSELSEDAVDLPHVTWCPTGTLSFLPLHAAGIYDSHDGSKVFDFVVSSYTTTVSALLQQRPQQRAEPQPPAKNILVVSQPGIPNVDELPGIREEVVNVMSHFSDGSVLHLDDTDATAGAVLNVLRKQSFDFVHLACHGRQDANDPSKSAFMLHGGSLLLSEIMKLPTANASLAFLSACQTATGDLKLPEEAVHLTAGMLVAGYKAVIGTMWSIYDKDAPLVADEVYRRLLKDQDGKEVDGARLKTAYALHAAVEVLRNQVGESSFERWVPFVHFGI